MKILFFFIFSIHFIFSQSSIIQNKKKGFYLTAEDLYLNRNTESLYEKINDSTEQKIVLNESVFSQNKNKIFVKNKTLDNYFAYSDGKFVYFNSKNYKNTVSFLQSDYFMQSIRWKDFYFFEEQIVSVVPGGFVGVGVGMFSVFDMGFSGNISVQNLFCSFDIKKENFFCVEKQEIRRRIKKNYPAVFQKYRKSKKTLQNYLEALQEIETIDSLGIEKIIY